MESCTASLYSNSNQIFMIKKLFLVETVAIYSEFWPKFQFLSIFGQGLTLKSAPSFDFLLLFM